MKRLSIRVLAAIFTFSLGLAAVAFYVTRQQRPSVPPNLGLISQINDAPSPIPEVAPILYPEAPSVRSIDFNNYTYPGSTYGEYQDYFPEQRFTLENGKWGDWRYGMTILNVSYDDVTSDRAEEAILNFRQETDGSAGQKSVYIYTLENARPKLLWAFTSGDRSEGGLRKVSAQNGKLVIELYGKGTKIAGSSATSGSEFTAMCCPKSYTRTQYEWVDGSFRQHGEMKVFANPEARNWK